MPNFLNHVRVTTSTTGTGTITLGSAIAGFQSFSAAGAIDGKVYPYEIRDGDAWELGWGTYTASGTTLARSLISSSTGSLLNLNAGATVSVVAHAESLRFMGAKVRKASALVGTNIAGTSTAQAWDSEDFDTDGFHDNVTNNSRLTPPSGKGINYVELEAHFRIDSTHTSAQYASAFIRDQAGTTIVTQRIELTTTNVRVTVNSGPVAHTDGNWYDVVFETETDTSVDISTISHFSIRVAG